jgi:ABC-2 type transport system permease protein
VSRTRPLHRCEAALRNRPRLAAPTAHLFLDELTSGLDPQTRNQIWEFISGLCRDEHVTVFFTTHYIEEAERVADRIAVIDHGRIVAEGTAAALRQSDRRPHPGGRVHRADWAQHPRGRGHTRRSHAHDAPGVARSPVNAVYILWLRQLKRYFRSRARMIGSLGQPTLFLLALGFGLGPTFARAGRGDYLQFLAPGIVTMGILFTAVFSGIEIIWDRQLSKETLVAPVSRLEIVLGRTLGSATVARIQGSIVFIVCVAAGFRPSHPLLLPLALLFMALIAIMSTAIGTAVGSVLQDMHGFPLIMNFIVLPLFFFSSALFPVPDLPGPVRLAVRLNPLSYGVDGLRGALSGGFAFGVATDFAVLGGLAAILLAIGAYLFSKIEV